MQKLIALKGKSRVGKSMAIRMARDELLKRYPYAQQSHHSRRRTPEVD